MPHIRQPIHHLQSVVMERSGPLWPASDEGERVRLLVPVRPRDIAESSHTDVSSGTGKRRRRPWSFIFGGLDDLGEALCNHRAPVSMRVPPLRRNRFDIGWRGS